MPAPLPSTLETSVNRLAPALLLLTGCFKPFGDLPELDFSEISYDNPLLEVDDAALAVLDTDLVCPDGEPARLLAVYRTDIEEPQPVAIVLHSGPFDYLETTDTEAGEAPEPATPWRVESRLTRSWSIAKVWETLGISPSPVDPGEVHLGALPAALTNAGVIQLYPANCWGDLWHGDATDANGGEAPEAEDDALVRDGLTAAAWTIRYLYEGDFAATIDFNVPATDSSQLYLIGMGEGGRGVGELLSLPNLPPISGVLVDSTPDRLDPWLAEPLTWPDEVAAIEDIYGDTDPAVVDGASLGALSAAGLLPERVGYVWSSIDPQVPVGATAPTAERIAADLPSALVLDTGARTHIQLNGDLDLATAAVGYLLTGDAAAPQTDR